MLASRRSLMLLMAILVLAGCGGGGAKATLPTAVAPNVTATVVPTAAPSAAPGGGVTAAPPDDWVTFAHDQARSGLETAATGLNRTTVAALAPRWKVSLRENVWASPIVTGGFVYVATDAGNVYALDAASGAQRWMTHVGASVRMTPAAYDGMLFVGVYGVPGAFGAQPTGAAFVALDAATGGLRWTARPPSLGGVGLIRGEPVVLGGVVYEGLAGGDDFTGCVTGGIMAFDEHSGALARPFWTTTAQANNGGGVWSPLSTDGTTLFAGTGNLCGNETAEYGDAAVALGTNLGASWVAHTWDPGGYDEDVGGGVNVANRLAYVSAKSGLLYALDRGSGLVVWTHDFQPWTRGGGGIGTPTGDGTMIIAGGGELTQSDPNGCLIGAFDLSGNALYTLHASYVVRGAAAFVPGVGFLGLDHALVAFDARSGATLWSSGDLGANMYASPAVVPSGVYTATFSGDVLAFSLGTTSSAGRLRRR
jgi:outer membrane protein assembly factor BamB